MSGESQQTPQTEPDPSVLTTEQLHRAIRSEREITNAQLDTIRQRLADIDRATVVLNEQVTKAPTEVQTQIGHLKELHAAEIQSIRDAASKQDAVNQQAILKAENAAVTNGTVNSSKIDDLNKRVGRIEDRKEGGQDLTKAIYAAIATGIALVAFYFMFTNATNDTPTPDPIVVEVPVNDTP